VGLSATYDHDRAVALVLLGLSGTHPQRLTIRVAELDGGLDQRATKRYQRALENLAAKGVIAYDATLAHAATFREARLTNSGAALLSRVPHADGQTHAKRLESALTADSAALLRIAVDEVLTASEQRDRLQAT
jgi:hypothetical protein